MLSQHERNEIRRNPYLKLKELENQFDLVTYFYPDQRLTIRLTENDIIDITDCGYKEAMRYRETISEKYKSFHAKPFDFCDHMGIDEMFIQVFLASLRTQGPLPPKRKRKPAPTNPQDALAGPPRLIKDVKADLQKGILESFETLQMRAKVWLSHYPPGEPMYKVAHPRFRIIIRPFEVANILDVHIQTARAMFNEARSAYNLPKQRFMDLRMFCHVHHLDTEDTRRSVSEMHDDPPETNN